MTFFPHIIMEMVLLFFHTYMKFKAQNPLYFIYYIFNFFNLYQPKPFCMDLAIE
jgi:hypothetical protein